MKNNISDFDYDKIYYTDRGIYVGKYVNELYYK